jgi:hypothetical protein
MFVIYPRTKFQISSSNGALIIVIKTKAEQRFQAASILLYYIA